MTREQLFASAASDLILASNSLASLCSANEKHCGETEYMAQRVRTISTVLRSAECKFMELDAMPSYDIVAEEE